MENIFNFEEFLIEAYNKPRGGMKSRWSVKYKKSINCSNPKGFSQKNYCKRKKRGGKYKHVNENIYLYSAINSHNLNYDDLIKYGVKINSNFYKWNNNSKFIGVYYHGSKANFTEFKIEKEGEHSHAYGIYFTDSPSHASTYTPFEELDDEYDISKLDKLDINKSKYLYPCFLRVNNPFIMMKSDRININEWMKLDSELKSKPVGKNWEKKLINKDLDFIGDFIQDFGCIDFTNLLISKGYDGIFLNYPEWIVFNPNQIKSIWNDGSWDINDNNIYS